MRKQEDKTSFIEKLALELQFEHRLRDEGDHQTHATEVILPALPNGQYLIVAKPVDKDHLAHTAIQVTNLALTERDDAGEKVFQLIDRNNGKPIPAASILLTYRRDYNTNSERKERFTTDQKGTFTLKREGPLPEPKGHCRKR